MLFIHPALPLVLQRFVCDVLRLWFKTLLYIHVLLAAIHGAVIFQPMISHLSCLSCALSVHSTLCYMLVCDRSCFQQEVPLSCKKMVMYPLNLRMKGEWTWCDAIVRILIHGMTIGVFPCAFSRICLEVDHDRRGCNGEVPGDMAVMSSLDVLVTTRGFGRDQRLSESLWSLQFLNSILNFMAVKIIPSKQGHVLLASVHSRFSSRMVISNRLFPCCVCTFSKLCLYFSSAITPNHAIVTVPQNCTALF